MEREIWREKFVSMVYLQRDLSSMGGNINLNNNIIITDIYLEAGWDVLICVLLYNDFFNHLTLSLNCKSPPGQGL